FLPVLRLGRQLLHLPARARPSLLRVLHPDQVGRRTLAPDLELHLLAARPRTTFRQPGQGGECSTFLSHSSSCRSRSQKRIPRTRPTRPWSRRIAAYTASTHPA